MKLMELNRIDGFLLFNFLAIDKENAEEIMEAGKGFVVPGIVSSDFVNIEDGVKKVNELKEVAKVVSIGLGDNGNPANWEKVLKIAEGSEPGHINQPFDKTSYSLGYLNAKGIHQVVNGLVAPSGTVGFVTLSTGVEMKVEVLVDLAVAMGIESIKFMPLKGKTHLEELVYLCKVAAEKGLKAIEPAGGISSENIVEIVNSVRPTGIPVFMPHVFGSTIHKETGRTIPEEVEKIITLVMEDV
ncbi:KDGP aldolase [Bacillus sp. B-jedd]|uniref:KDGP aldolase n=1 Tax=Bacillus sp. B-jedd TaxID=1476857 RepID=UPI00051569CB|nr:KDGP aldolase [Bacillus sp. B-jedd]CEG28741.1 4-hydroxy-2-ketovalerate aldolase [Bacillus sp. B-jedd]